MNASPPETVSLHSTGTAPASAPATEENHQQKYRCHHEPKVKTHCYTLRRHGTDGDLTADLYRCRESGEDQQKKPQQHKKKHIHHVLTHQYHSADGYPIKSSNSQSSQRSRNHSHSHSHHHHNRKPRRHYYHRNGHCLRYHYGTCPRRHRSHTDMSTASVNTCYDPCPDHEVREILIKRPCCSASKTELVQYFVGDLYGRRSSCCTSSDYCYHTDSTSLYGSRSSLSRNNSIKSSSSATHRKKIRCKRSTYQTYSLGRLHHSHPGSLIGSTTSILGDKAKSGSGKMIVSPSKVTIEYKSKSSQGDSKDILPEYACSPSPIRWSFLAESGSKTPSDFDVGAAAAESCGSVRHPYNHQSSQSSLKRSEESLGKSSKISKIDESSLARRSSRKEYIHAKPQKNRDGNDCCSGCNASKADIGAEESKTTTVVFHQEGEAFNNCCSNNYMQCNAFLDRDLQITSEDICEYLSKDGKEGILNNCIKKYPFQPSNALEFQYKKNFTNLTDELNACDADHYNATYMQCDKERSTNSTNSGSNFKDNNTTSQDNLMSLDETLLTGGNVNTIFITSDSIEASRINDNYEVKFINTSRKEGSGQNPTTSSDAFGNYRSRSNDYALSSSSYYVDSSNSHYHHHRHYHHQQQEQHQQPQQQPRTVTTTNYDLMNVSTNSLFDKPIGIDEIPSIKSAKRNNTCRQSDETIGGAANASTSSALELSFINLNNAEIYNNNNNNNNNSNNVCSSSSRNTNNNNNNNNSNNNSNNSNNNNNNRSNTYNIDAGTSGASFSNNSVIIHNPLGYRYSSNSDRAGDFGMQQQENFELSPSSPILSKRSSLTNYHHNIFRRHHHHHHHHHSFYNYRYRWQHVTDNFKISNAFRKVRKRARKYAQYLRKK